MKRFSLIMLSQTGNKKVIYDFDTGKYMQRSGTSSKNNSYVWLLFQPFAIFGLEIFGQWLLAYPVRVRMIMGIIAFLLGGLVGVVGVLGAIVSGMFISFIARRNFVLANGDVLGMSNEVGRLFALIFMSVALYFL